MKKNFIFFLFFSFIVYFSHAQDNVEVYSQTNEDIHPTFKKIFDWNKFFWGGNLDLSFGDHSIFGFTPQAGYRFSRSFAAGGGFNLMLVAKKKNDTTGNGAYKISEGVTGVNFFARVYPVKFLLLQVQPEMNYIFGKIQWYNPMSKTNIDAVIVPSIMMGGGTDFKLGKGTFIATITYDVLQRGNSPYSSQPVLNLGYNFGK